MAYGVVDVYNQACSSVTTLSRISDPGETSTEALECTLWYETVRDAVLGSAFWPEAKAVQRLGLFATRDDDVAWVATDPLPGWEYAYGPPSDMLRPRYLTSFAQFEMALRNGTPSIVTNQATPILVYTARQPNPQYWQAPLRLSIVHMLAAKIARKLTGSRSKMLDNFNIAAEMILVARAESANQMQYNLDFTPEAIVARGGSSATLSRYLFPHGDYSFLSGGNVG